MELPLGGPALRHYTQSRPRPHRQKLNYRPSRPQETIIESENEALELMGRVDEGVEEFFTKRVLPTDTLKQQDEETITVDEVAPASSVPCPPPTKTLRRKLGDFFTLKKRRGLKSEPSQEGRPKKASIADFIRPLRDAARSEKEKDKDRVKEQDKENEKEKAKDQSGAVTGESAVKETPVSAAAPLRGDAVPPRRALREGKSQSLILLSGSAAAGTTNARNTAKKQLEGQHSFEQKLHLMLQRIGVSKPQPGETQSQEGEMKKADSEGTIIDNKPEPPPTFSKPRTMSASSDTRHQIRASVSAHEGAGKPALLPKPVIKPGPPPTTSGRNTPENELAQIEEAETNTPTKQSPALGPPAPALTATTTPTVPTISNSTPDSTDSKVSQTSTLAPSDIDVCTQSVSPTAAATTPTKDTVVDSKATISESSVPTSDVPTSTFIAPPTSTTTPTEALPTVSVASTSSESITTGLSVTSTSATTTRPSITTSETVLAPSTESSVPTTSTNLPTKSALPEPEGILSADPTPVAAVVAAAAAAAADDDAMSPVTTTASSPSTSTSDMPPGLSAPIYSMTDASGESTAVASESLITTSSPPSLRDIATATISQDTPISSSSAMISATLPLATSPSSSNKETAPTTASDSLNSVSPSTIAPSATTGHDDISVPSTSSSETNPTDTTSTATCLNHAETTSTTSSATAVSSALPTDSDTPSSNNDSMIHAPTSTTIPATDNSSATSHHVTSPAPLNDSPGQDKSLSPEERSDVKPAETGKAAQEEVEVVQETNLPKTDEKKDDGPDSVSKSFSDNEKPILAKSDATRKEVVEESMKAEEDSHSEPGSGKEDEQSKEEGVAEGVKQEETKPVSDK